MERDVISLRREIQNHHSSIIAMMHSYFLGVFILTFLFVLNARAQFYQLGNKLVGTGAVGASYQGASVALSGDGNTAIVGGHEDNGGVGAAWIYTRVNGVWSQQGTKLVGSGATGVSTQGVSVALSWDGNTAIVGGYYDNGLAGAAWVFTRNGNVWKQQGGKLIANDAIGSSFFGYSVHLSGDGNTAVIGGPVDNGQQYAAVGAAWVFTRSDSIWRQQGKKLVGTGASGLAYQGISVAISSDGNTIIVGGNSDSANVGAAWIFTRSDTVWEQQGNKLVGSGVVSPAQEGDCVSLSSDGNTAIIGGGFDNSDKGAAWIFTRSGATWTQQGTKLVGIGAAGNALQGSAVSISGDGNTVIVGGYSDSSNTGAAWIYSRNGGVWTEQGSKLVGSGATGASAQGWSVGLSGDGLTAIVGGRTDDYDLGAAWIYGNSEGTHNIILSVDTVTAHPGDTVKVPFHLQLPPGKSYDAAEVSFSGFLDKLHFLGLDTASTLIGSHGWQLQVNGSDSIALSASAGANEIRNNGVLFNARFAVVTDSIGVIPITIQHAVFNTGSDTVVIINGGVNVKIKLTPIYGDVDKNGIVQAADAALLLKYLVGETELDDQELVNADVTNNGSVSALDATAILKYVVHLITSFPADSTVMGPLTAEGQFSMEGTIQGDTESGFEVPINLLKGNNILSFEGMLKFDAQSVSYQNIVWSPLLNQSDIVILVDSAAGIIHFAGASMQPISSAMTFASVHFKASKDGESTVSLQELRINEGMKMTNIGSSQVVTKVSQDPSLVPTAYALAQNYPNPFNPTTTISYQLPKSGTVTLKVYDILGRETAVLVDEQKPAGFYQATFDASKLSSGLYFYRLEAGSFVQTKKLLLVK